MNKSIIKIVPISQLKIKDLPNEVIELIYDFVYGVFKPYSVYYKYYNFHKFNLGVLDEQRIELKDELFNFLHFYDEKENIKLIIKYLNHVECDDGIYRYVSEDGYSDEECDSEDENLKFEKYNIYYKIYIIQNNIKNIQKIFL